MGKTQKLIRASGNPKYMQFKDFINEVMGYESDTFSASASGITRDEADAVVLEVMKTLWDNRIDGILLSEALAEVRGENNE